MTKIITQHVDKIPKTSNTLLSRYASPNDDDDDDDDNTILHTMEKLADEMKSNHASQTPLSEQELSNIVSSVKNVLPENHTVNLEKLKDLLNASCHYSHKDWDKTCASAETLKSLLLLQEKGLNPTFRALMERCLEEGGWDRAASHAASSSSKSSKSKPWAILVTGVNGIRKTTSVYQPWFSTVLSQALISPEEAKNEKETNKEDPAILEEELLPTGQNSFFRQLDHIIAILANVEFSNLYSFTTSAVSSSENDLPISSYAKLKDSIFIRYRTLAEMMGIILVDKAKEEQLNIMVETSGKDVAMFHYIDRFFDQESYNKLALHFTIQDIQYAEVSVDQRMKDEISEGMKALQSQNVKDIIYGNKGGPYGSDVLKGVQRDSEKVWKEDVLGGNVGTDWYKATIEISGSEDEGAWTACARRPDGTLGDVFKFGRK